MLTSGSTKPAAFDLATQVQIFRDNEPVITTPLRKLTPNGVDLRRIPYSAEVKLDQLRAGSYVLQVTVLDRLTKATTTRKTVFEIY